MFWYCLIMQFVYNKNAIFASIRDMLFQLTKETLPLYLFVKKNRPDFEFQSNLLSICSMANAFFFDLADV